MPKLESSKPSNNYGGYKGSAQNHHFVIENVIDRLLYNKEVRVNIEESIEVIDIIERIYKERNKNFNKINE